MELAKLIQRIIRELLPVIAESRTRRSLLLLDFRSWGEEKNFYASGTVFCSLLTQMYLFHPCAFSCVRQLLIFLLRSEGHISLYNCVIAPRWRREIQVWEDLLEGDCKSSGAGCPLDFSKAANTLCWLEWVSFGDNASSWENCLREVLSHCNLLNWSRTSCPRRSLLGSSGGARRGVEVGQETAAKQCSVPSAANRTAQALCQKRNLISLLTNETRMWLEVPRFGGMSNFPIINHPNQTVFISLHYLAAIWWQTMSWILFFTRSLHWCDLWALAVGCWGKGRLNWASVFKKDLAKTTSVIIS